MEETEGGRLALVDGRDAGLEDSGRVEVAAVQTACEGSVVLVSRLIQVCGRAGLGEH